MWVKNLQLTPPTPPNFSVGTSQGWADVIGGANIVVPFSPKIAVLVPGDAGGGGANVDYQVAGLVNYQIKPKWGIGLGYRYLDVNYRNTNQNILDITQAESLSPCFTSTASNRPSSRGKQVDVRGGTAICCNGECRLFPRKQTKTLTKMRFLGLARSEGSVTQSIPRPSGRLLPQLSTGVKQQSGG